MRAADVDRCIEYRHSPNVPRDGRCRLRLFTAERVAVVTELDDNPGMSVTNAIEAVAAVAEFEIRQTGHDDLSWLLVEHYERPAGTVDTFDVVSFGGRDAVGRPMGPSWRSAIGVPSLSWLYAGDTRDEAVRPM